MCTQNGFNSLFFNVYQLTTGTANRIFVCWWKFFAATDSAHLIYMRRAIIRFNKSRDTEPLKSKIITCKGTTCGWTKWKKKNQKRTTSTKNLHKSQPQEWLKEVHEPRKWNKNRNQIDGKNNKRQIKAETRSVKPATTTTSIYIKTNASTDRRCVLFFFVKLILF